MADREAPDSEGSAPKRPLTKADTDAFFERKRAELRERRAHKLTGEELQQRFDQRRAERKQRASSGEGARGGRVSLAIGVTLLLAAGGVGVASQVSSVGFSEQALALEEEAQALKVELSGLTAVQERDPEEHRVDIEAQLDAATTAATEVANLQQQFQQIAFDARDEATENNGAPSAGSLALVEHRRTLAPFFAEEAFLVDDEIAYSQATAAQFDSDQMDPRYAWFQPFIQAGDRNWVPTDPGTAAWSLVSTTAAAGGGSVSVVWMNQNPATGDLYAWATAQYEVESGSFTDLAVHHTTLGSKMTLNYQMGGVQ